MRLHNLVTRTLGCVVLVTLCVMTMAEAHSVSKRSWFHDPNVPEWCRSSQEQMDEAKAAAPQIQCYEDSLDQVEEQWYEDWDEAPRCKLPFQYKPYDDEGPPITYYSCKRTESHDSHVFERQRNDQHHFDNKWDYWCATKVSPDGVFRPGQPGNEFRYCRPEWCDGLDRVCLSDTGRLCHFPFFSDGKVYFSCRKNGERYECPTSVSEEINGHTCSPQDNIFFEECDEMTACSFEGDEESEREHFRHLPPREEEEESVAAEEMGGRNEK